MAELTIAGRCVGFALDHAYLRFEMKDGCSRDAYAKKESVLAEYQCTWGTLDVYSYGVYYGMIELDPRTPAQSCARIVKAIAKEVINVFPHIRTMNPSLAKL
mgnify:FL=1